MKQTNKSIFESKYFYFTLGFIAGVVILLFIGLNNDKDYNLKEKLTYQEDGKFPQGYQIITPKMPEDPTFAGEEVPVDNFEVAERVEREMLVNTYWHSNTMLSIKRANRWFPVIEPILDKYDIPEDMKYLGLIESGFENVISPANAVGFWQILASTAREYGLEVADEIDERYSVEKSTEAAAKYLRYAYNKFGSWTLAAASYNMGITGVERQLERQKAKNYYNLVLSSETSRYIARIIAMKTIVENPADYGFKITGEDLYPPFDTKDVVINSSIQDLAGWAFKQGINYKTLKIYNPWLRDNYLRNRTGKTYVIKIPKEGSIEIIE